MEGNRKEKTKPLLEAAGLKDMNNVTQVVDETEQLWYVLQHGGKLDCIELCHDVQAIMLFFVQKERYFCTYYLNV